MQPNAADQKTLLALARRSIESAVSRAPAAAMFEPPLSAGLNECAAAFVTLHEEGALRGCIGLMRFDEPLWRNVRDAAISAALNDPRFMPVAPPEVPLLEIEISVLDPPVEIADPAMFEAGRHGIVIERAGRRGLLLPQVAPEMGWGAREMLEGVCRKAGLPTSAWSEKGSRLYVFESFCFAERHAEAIQVHFRA